MAETNGEQKQSEISGGDEPTLRYLGFVHVAAIRLLVFALAAYEFGKARSGSLRGSVERVEGAVTGLVGPVFQKLRDAPLRILELLDGKVGSSIEKLEQHVPAVVWYVYAAVQKVPTAACALVLDVQHQGVIATVTSLVKDSAVRYQPTAKELYAKYEPMAQDLYAKYEPQAEQYALAAWRRLNALPLFPQAAQIAVPTAAYWAERYNGIVAYGREKGYTVACYIPVIPLERIAKVFGSNGSSDVASDVSE